MSSTNEQELMKNNISEMQKILDSSGQYVSIGVGGKTVLQFLPEKGITQVEKEYNGQKLKKVRFIVKDVNSGINANADKFFDVGKRSARPILKKLEAGHRMLKIERFGEGKDTLYIPTEISATPTATAEAPSP
jgi:hypothetical protein